MAGGKEQLPTGHSTARFVTLISLKSTVCFLSLMATCGCIVEGFISSDSPNLAFLATRGVELVGKRQILLFAGKGFGKDSKNYSPPSKSYGKRELSPINDVIDEESSMREFFESNDAWQPLFRSIISDDSVPAMSFIDNNEEFEFTETSSPWKRLGAIPTDEDDIVILGTFLDAMQKSLIEDIPVDETTKEDDDNDLHFVEEGRRMLVCSRYHVVQKVEKGSIDTFDRLFSICWSEIVELSQSNEIDTGSLIVTPGFDYNDLRRFADMNLQRPLQWLGIDAFEVACLEKGGLGVIRIIHRLSDIPKEMPASPPDA